VTPMLLVAYVAAGAVVAGAAFLAFRLFRPTAGRKARRWVDRSEVDRRQHRVPVPKERRKGPRRQADIAKQFLDRVERRDP